MGCTRNLRYGRAVIPPAGSSIQLNAGGVVSYRLGKLYSQAIVIRDKGKMFRSGHVIAEEQGDAGGLHFWYDWPNQIPALVVERVLGVFRIFIYNIRAKKRNV